MQTPIRNIGFAGAGNLAWHLAGGLKQRGFSISGICSREISHARALAASCDSLVYTELPGLCENSDLIIIAVPDNVIEQVALGVGSFNGMVVHTAGSVPMQVLDGIFDNFGVFYPLQTFSKEIPADLAEVPFFLEASSPEVVLSLRQLASGLSGKVYEISSEQRLLLHVAAVFAGNYSNFMYAAGNEILKNSGLPPEVLHPLILETARKAVTSDPLKTQTGPARRQDTTTLAKHIEALASQPVYADLYRLLADLISNKYK
ncbi:MAG: DUF2520 domain-containing protein [Bacteroidota bacterium]